MVMKTTLVSVCVETRRRVASKTQPAELTAWHCAFLQTLDIVKLCVFVLQT